jgi:lysozyme
MDRNAAISLIKEFEQFRSNSYLDSEGVPTIGWGNTEIKGRPVSMGQTIDRAAADKLFDETFNNFTTKLLSVPEVRRLNPNVQAALASFSYNSGANWFGHKDFATLTAAVKSGDTKRIADALGLYTNGGNAGLVRRRQREAELAMRPVQRTFGQTIKPAPTSKPTPQQRQKPKGSLFGNPMLGFVNGASNLSNLFIRH